MSNFRGIYINEQSVSASGVLQLYTEVLQSEAFMQQLVMWQIKPKASGLSRQCSATEL